MPVGSGAVIRLFDSGDLLFACQPVSCSFTCGILRCQKSRWPALRLPGRVAVVNVIQINPAPSPPRTEPERSKECPNFS